MKGRRRQHLCTVSNLPSLNSVDVKLIIIYGRQKLFSGLSVICRANLFLSIWHFQFFCVFALLFCITTSVQLRGV